jgi:endoglucanase
MRRRDALKLLGLATLRFRRAAAAEDGPAFLFNQLGFLPGAEKVATVRGGGAETGFRVLAEPGGAVVHRGRLSEPRVDALSGDTVRLANFSAVERPGRYRLEAGSLRSEVFPVEQRVYGETLRATVRSYYGQRCGCAVDLGGGYKHPACHAAGEFGSTSGKTGSLANAGGWHDAGDYGRYVVNSGITCGTLLYAWEMFPEALRGLKLEIPESAEAMPDYLAEVRWNLQWMLAMQDADGGVFHKQTSKNFCGFVMPERDALMSEVIGTGEEPFKSTCATADFAAVMSIASRCYADYDLKFAERCRNAARAAWDWAEAHPAVTFRNPPGIGTGGYGDEHCGDERMWASAELWRTTGEAEYEQGFLAGLSGDLGQLHIGVPGWGNVESLACWTYAMAPWPGRAEVKAAIREKTLAAARGLAERRVANGYGTTMQERDYDWGSNAVAANQAVVLAMAAHFWPRERGQLMDAALGNLHYLLGRNCFGVSWVTQVGTRPFEHPHHRPSVADGIAAPWPGLLSGGPNRHPGDEVARRVATGPPMRMWVDDAGAYSMNEVAINWNAPLVFLLAAANGNPP